jgi:hypothetical protein
MSGRHHSFCLDAVAKAELALTPNVVFAGASTTAIEFAASV